MNEHPLFIVVATNSGGEGKTTTSKIFKALLNLASPYSTVVIDADEGNWASSISDPKAAPLGWTVTAKAAPRIIGDCAGQNVILDPGANAFAASLDFARLVPALLAGFEERGYRTIVLHPISTNKIGALDSVLELSHTFAGREQYYVIVNRDGSGHLNGGQHKLEGLRLIQIPHIQPGFQAVLHTHENWEQAIISPEAGFRRAGDHIGHWLADIVRQPTVAAIVGEAAVAEIEAFCGPRPFLNHGRRTKSDCTDHSLDECERRSRITQFLFNHDFTRDALLTAAERFF